MTLFHRLVAAFWRRFLFWIGRRDPERAHDLLLGILAFASQSEAGLRIASLSVQPVEAAKPRGHRYLMGIQFGGPVGLAAGFDKNGRCLPALAKFGFGFLEAGGVTVVAQAGNAKPRIRRFNQQRAIVNSLGFPNEGVDAVVQRLKRSRNPGVPVGWNLAKARNTSVEKAGGEFVTLMEHLWPHADYFSLNISSPNTPGLRQLEAPKILAATLRQVVDARDIRAEEDERRPLLLKISPDMHPEDLDTVVDVAVDEGIDGIIAVNTSVSRLGLPGYAPRTGGMSGHPLHEKAVATVARVAERAGSNLVVVGVGGITSPADAARMMSAGASLIEVCTGFIFAGPPLIEEINARIRPAWLSS